MGCGPRRRRLPRLAFQLAVDAVRQVGVHADLTAGAHSRLWLRSRPARLNVVRAGLLHNSQVFRLAVDAFSGFTLPFVPSRRGRGGEAWWIEGEPVVPMNFSVGREFCSRPREFRSRAPSQPVSALGGSSATPPKRRRTPETRKRGGQVRSRPISSGAKLLHNSLAHDFGIHIRICRQSSSKSFN
jgi:hypothetical protein